MKGILSPVTLSSKRAIIQDFVLISSTRVSFLFNQNMPSPLEAPLEDWEDPKLSLQKFPVAFIISTSSNFVSWRNTIDGDSCFIISLTARFLARFPSPLMFQDITFITCEWRGSDHHPFLLCLSFSLSEFLKWLFYSPSFYLVLLPFLSVLFCLVSRVSWWG